MKESIQIIISLLAVLAAFLLGWLAMPRLWAGFKRRVLYALHSEWKPKPPASTREPYRPTSSYGFRDAIRKSDSLIYYFYKGNCPHCRVLEPLTAGLPKEISLPGGEISAVKLVGLNKNDDEFAAVISRYNEEYGIPEERQFVPSMVIGARYLLGGEEIVHQLMDALAHGEGLMTPVLNGTERSDAVTAG